MDCYRARWLHLRRYQLTRTETPIGTPYRMQPRGTGAPLDFIEIARTSPDTLSITAHFKAENAAIAAGALGETLVKDVTVERTVNTPTSRDIKVWEIRYPSNIETDEKYLATEPKAAGKE